MRGKMAGNYTNYEEDLNAKEVLEEREKVEDLGVNERGEDNMKLCIREIRVIMGNLNRTGMAVRESSDEQTKEYAGPIAADIILRAEQLQAAK